MKIKNTAIIGMGALGLLYGEAIVKACGRQALRYVMDKERCARHKKDTYTINGVKQDFILQSAEEAEPVDLILVATKYSGLAEAIREMEGLVGQDTVIFSVLNGITKEQEIIKRYGDKNIVYSVALGMDAVRSGTSLTYEHQGMLKIGIVDPKQQSALDALSEFLTLIGVKYSVEKDIMHALWAKLLLNVGINQTCMVYETDYGGALSGKESRASMIGAMGEVVAVAQKEGINLTNADTLESVRVISGLAPEGLPSMRQDALAHRLSEVELFAGTVCRLAAKHKISVPVNEYYYKKIKEMEAAY